MADLVQKGSFEEVSFTIQTIDCITCSPLFQRALRKVEGVIEIKGLPMTNKIVVIFDGSKLNRQSLLDKISTVSQRAGLRGKIIFHR